jgi:hypothetical protein
MVAADRLDSILLTAQEINTLMGAANMQPNAPIAHSSPPPPTNMSNPDCLGALFPGVAEVYRGSGYGAMSRQYVREPVSNPEHEVIQTAMSFTSADLALAFVKNSAGKWRTCAGQTISVTINSGVSQFTFGDLVGDAPTIAQLQTQVGVSGYPCQHVLSAVWNLVVDVVACGHQISDQARQIADKMAAKATQ